MVPTSQLTAACSFSVELEAEAKAVARLAGEGAQALLAARPAPTPSQVATGRGLWPSLQDCVDGLEALSTMLRDELEVKRAICDALTYGTSEEDAAALLVVLEDEPNLPPLEVRTILERVTVAGMS
eukprot:SM000231S07474  [mRNA]  locus=s231:42285:43276:+ [translate_table: standard]